MKPFRAALVTSLKANSSLTAITSSYGGEDGVFSGTKGPPPAAMPYVFVAGPVSNEPWEDKDQAQAFNVNYRIASVASSNNVADQMALIVHENFHRQALTVTGYSVKDVRCGGPVEGPGDEEHATTWVGVQIKAVKES